MDSVRISCPKCKWKPDKESLWWCTCTTMWNTFETGGRCPGCGKVWKHTQCLSCHQWSPHLDWYEGLDSVVENLKEEIEKSWSVPVRK